MPVTRINDVNLFWDKAARSSTSSDAESSPPFFPLVVDKVAAVIPHAERKIFKNAGHVPHISHPTEYINTLTNFILKHN